MKKISENDLDNILLQIPEVKNNYQKSILKTFKESPLKEINDNSKIVIFSDQHRGSGDHTDDFKKENEITYLKALDYYSEEKAFIILNGDIEELAKYELMDCLNAHPKTYSTERDIFLKGNLLKLDGNHEGYLQGKSSKELNLYFPGIVIHPGVKLKYKDRGYIFIFRGHQGGTNDGYFRILNNWFIRNIWLPIQKTFKIKRPTPATDITLNTEAEQTLYNTAELIPHTLTVAGHTHNFFAASEMPVTITRVPPFPVEKRKPCYFNSGCGIYENGKVTCVEIFEGKIESVVWMGAQRLVVHSYSLEKLLEKC